MSRRKPTPWERRHAAELKDRAAEKRDRKGELRRYDETLVRSNAPSGGAQRAPDRLRCGDGRHHPKGPTNAAKRELIAQASRACWKGRSYRKALRFSRALDRAERAAKRGAR